MEELDSATLGGGCFWCLEAVYTRLDGVKSVVPGYAGGNIENPTYEQVCTGETSHAEVVKISFDPKETSFETLLEWFWKCHDPTTPNRQGNDIGTQYRSVIFYHNDDQKKIAINSKEKANKSGYWSNKIITEVTKIFNYTDAEDYHNNYYDNNPNQPYCLFVIKPKLDKLIDDGIIK